MLALAQRLADRLGWSITPAELRALGDALAAALGEARRRWPAVALSDAGFLDDLAGRVGDDEPGELGTRCLPDLYLAAACATGDRAAAQALEQLLRDEAPRALARVGASPDEIAEVVQELLIRLLVAGDRPAKLAAFTGHGALRAWLRVAAVRTALSQRRRHRPELAVDDDALALHPDDADDPALAFLKASYRAEFKRAFATAVAALTPRQRTLLRLQVIDQLTLEEVGRFYQVSRATAARWLAEARSALVDGTRTRLVAELALDGAELDGLMKLVASSLYASLPGFLAASAPADR